MVSEQSEDAINGPRVSKLRELDELDLNSIEKSNWTSCLTLNI